MMQQLGLLLLVLVSALLLLSSSAQAPEVVVDVQEAITARAVLFPEQLAPGIVRVLVEVQNNGSVGYRARPWMVVTGDGYRFVAWGEEKRIPPGGRGTFPLFWYARNQSQAHAAVTVSYGPMERLTLPAIPLEAQPALVEAAPATIIRARAREGTIRLLIDSRAAGNAIVVPLDLPPGWIVAQREVVLRPGRQAVSIGFDPGIPRPAQVAFAVVFPDGQASVSRLEIVQESGFRALLEDLLDFLEEALSR